MKQISMCMATGEKMLIPTKTGTTTTVSVEVAQKYYTMYKHHLTHNPALAPEEREYLQLYTEYFEKVSQSDYV